MMAFSYSEYVYDTAFPGTRREQSFISTPFIILKCHINQSYSLFALQIGPISPQQE